MPGSSTTPDRPSACAGALPAHGEHEKRTDQPDPNWPDWYADYIVREQVGTDLPT